MGVAESTVHNELPYFWPFQDATPAKDEVRRSSLASDKVDVLIIGAGPSGYETPSLNPLSFLHCSVTAVLIRNL